MTFSNILMNFSSLFKLQRYTMEFWQVLLGMEKPLFQSVKNRIFLSFFIIYENWTPSHGQAKAGRPARTYIQQLCEDMGCSPGDLPEAMNDREGWWERVRDIRADGMTRWWWLLLEATNIFDCLPVVEFCQDDNWGRLGKYIHALRLKNK